MKNCFKDWSQSRADPGRGGADGLGPLGKSQVYVGSLEYMYLVRTPLEKLLDPSGPIASRRGSVRPSVKYVEGFVRTHLTEFNFLDQPMLYVT